jgi:hypothetical protein
MICTPNIEVEWLTLRLRILDVPDSNVGMETGYRDRFFVVFDAFSETQTI